MYIRRSLPPFEYKSKCPSLMCSTLICMSSLTRAPVAAKKRITKYQNSSSSRLRQVLKYSYPDIYDEFVDQTESRIFKVVKSAIA